MSLVSVWFRFVVFFEMASLVLILYVSVVVYPAERKQSMGYDWHPECLRCDECGKRLNPGQHAEVWSTSQGTARPGRAGAVVSGAHKIKIRGRETGRSGWRLST